MTAPATHGVLRRIVRLLAAPVRAWRQRQRDRRWQLNLLAAMEAQLRAMNAATDARHEYSNLRDKLVPVGHEEYGGGAEWELVGQLASRHEFHAVLVDEIPSPIQPVQADPVVVAARQRNLAAGVDARQADQLSDSTGTGG